MDLTESDVARAVANRRRTCGLTRNARAALTSRNREVIIAEVLGSNSDRRGTAAFRSPPAMKKAPNTGRLPDTRFRFRHSRLRRNRFLTLSRHHRRCTPRRRACLQGPTRKRWSGASSHDAIVDRLALGSAKRFASRATYGSAALGYREYPAETWELARQMRRFALVAMCVLALCVPRAAGADILDSETWDNHIEQVQQLQQFDCFSANDESRLRCDVRDRQW
jgi:hypothetical protein